MVVVVGEKDGQQLEPARLGTKHVVIERQLSSQGIHTLSSLSLGYIYVSLILLIITRSFSELCCPTSYV